MAHQTALAQAGALQLISDLLAHAFDLPLQDLRLLTVIRLGSDHLGRPLQHRQRSLQAVRQVVQRVTVALALLAFAVEQAVQRAGEAQQFARMFVAEALTGTALHFVQLFAQPAQAAKAPGQAEPQQAEKQQQGAPEPQVELRHEIVVEGLRVAGRLHGDDTEGRALAAQQFDFHVIDIELAALAVGNAQQLIAAAVVTRQVGHGNVPCRRRLPDQAAVTVIDEAQQLGVGNVELLVRKLARHP